MTSTSRIGIARARPKSPAARRLPAGAPAAVLAAVLLCGPALAAEFYVATDGNDGNAGTKEKPFATLERARDAVRALSGAARAGGATVWIGGGTYQRDKCFELNERDSGAPNARVVYRGMPGEEVRLMGGRLIPVSAVKPPADPQVLERIVETNARSAVVQVDLKKLGIADYGQLEARGLMRPYRNPALELFFNDEPMRLARWPNKGGAGLGRVIDRGAAPGESPTVMYKDMDATRDRGGKFAYAGDRPDRWRQDGEIWLCGFFAYTWSPDMLRVKAIDTGKKTIELAQAHLWGLKGGHGPKDGLSYHAVNLLEELDEPGEYYTDKSRGILYFHPPSEITPQTRLAVSLLDEPVVALEGAGHVTLRDVVIEAARGIGVYIERGVSNIVGGCTLRNLGVVGVCIGMGVEPAKYTVLDGYAGKPVSRHLGSLPSREWWDSAFDRQAGTGHGVIGCDIFNTGAGGVSLGGGDRKTLTPGGNYVRNCHIRHYNRLDWSYKGAVRLTGVGNSIAHCLISDSPHSAVDYQSNDCVFEFNEIHHCVTFGDDAGALNTAGDPSARGNIIRGNFIHDVGSARARWAGSQAIFIDNGSGGDIIVSNVFVRAGSNGVIKHNGGGGSIIENNIFAACPNPIIGHVWNPGDWNKFINGPLLKKRLYEDVDIGKPPYSTRYPELAQYVQSRPAGSTARNNIVTGDLSQFADAKNLNFRLKEDSELLKKTPEFKPIPFGKIGLYRDEYRKTVPAVNAEQ